MPVSFATDASAAQGNHTETGLCDTLQSASMIRQTGIGRTPTALAAVLPLNNGYDAADNRHLRFCSKMAVFL